MNSSDPNPTVGPTRLAGGPDKEARATMRHDERLDEDTRLRTEDLVAAGETRHDGHEDVERRPDDADALPPPRTADSAEYSLPDNGHSLSDNSLSDNGNPRSDDEDRMRGDEEFPARAADTDLDVTDRDVIDSDVTGRGVTDTDVTDTGVTDMDPGRADTDAGTEWGRTNEEPMGAGATDVVPEQVEESARPTASSDDEDQAPLLFRPEDVDRFRTEWQQVQTMFVDDPREAVQSADHLVAEVMQALASMFNEHKQELEGNWREEGTDLQTEDLRIALRRYRSFFYQLLDA